MSRKVRATIDIDDDDRDYCPRQNPKQSENTSIHPDVWWIPVAIFLSIGSIIGLGSNHSYHGSGGSPVIVNNR